MTMVIMGGKDGTEEEETENEQEAEDGREQ